MVQPLQQFCYAPSSTSSVGRSTSAPWNPGHLNGTRNMNHIVGKQPTTPTVGVVRFGGALWTSIWAHRGAHFPGGGKGPMPRYPTLVQQQKQRETNCDIPWQNGKGDKLTHYLAGHGREQIVTFPGWTRRGTNCYISWPPFRSWRDSLTPSIHRRTQRETHCHMSWRDTKGDKLSHFLAPLQFSATGLDPEC